MSERFLVTAVFTGAMGRMVKLAIVGFAVAVMMAFVVADDAEASFGYSPPDSDGYVPVYSACYAGTELGNYSWYSEGNVVYGAVYVNDCALQRMGAGPNDRQYVIDHEMGHAYGYPHSSNPNSYMYPYYVITGT